MLKVFAINGSPRQENGNTARILSPFLEKLINAGADVSLFYASKLKIKPCSCGRMLCWNQTPGECIHQDGMQEILSPLKQSQVVVLATPVYIPFPSAMQNFLNRLCPLLDPSLSFKDGRTRARLREDVRWEKIVLVSTGGWWEHANVDIVERTVREFAAVANRPFAGSIVRPHAYLMRQEGKFTEQGSRVIEAVHRAADELLRDGMISLETQDTISQPLISKEEFFGLRA